METELQNNISFAELISKKIIEIPMIQRDFAQGRPDKKTSDIRDSFINAISESLRTNSPLLLDFVYGSTVDEVRFIPLDGQQRLTTLFLLHWYLLSKDKMELLQQIVAENTISKFTYQTRISSKDFCNALVNNSQQALKSFKKDEIKVYEDILTHYQTDPKDFEMVELLSSKIKSIKLSKVIMDQPWFNWGWRKDPTVKGMLVMLDEIDERFGLNEDNDNNELFDRLLNGSITFNLLPLEKFSLTDELYVKMNSRGKELSQFDILKSSLEEQMKLNGVNELIQNTWREKVDSYWIDLFWNKLAKININPSNDNNINIVNSVEKAYLIFLNRMILYHLLLDDTCLQCNWKDENTIRYIPFEFDENEILRDIRYFARENDISELMPLLIKGKFFNESFFSFVIKTFDNLIWAENEIKHDGSELISGVYFENKKANLFESIILDEEVSYELLLQFFCLLKFLDFNNASCVRNDKRLSTELNSWMRIIRNLTTLNNVYIDDFDDFYTTLLTFNKWCEAIYGNNKATVIEYFSTHPKNEVPKGRIVAPQFEEEIIKAILISDKTNGTEWEINLRNAEEHPYFVGQIRFLLDWSKTDNGYDLNLFKKYNGAILNVFSDNGLTKDLSDKDSHLFRNCLMANFGNYMLMKDKCLVSNQGKDRDRSWKSYLRIRDEASNNLLKSRNIKLIIDKWLPNSNSTTFSDFCKNEIKAALSSINDWRRCFLNFSEIYNKCEKDQIDFWDKTKNEICLLETSTKWTGNNRHSELNTYYWSLKFKDINGWNSNYFNSQCNEPLTVNFNKGNDFLKVAFLEINNQQSYEVKLNFDPKDKTYIIKDSLWTKSFDTLDCLQTESDLNVLLNN